MDSNYLTKLSPRFRLNIIINLHTRKTRNNTTITFVNIILTLTIMNNSFNTSNLQDIKNTIHESQAKEHY